MDSYAWDSNTQASSLQGMHCNLMLRLGSHINQRRECLAAESVQVQAQYCLHKVLKNDLGALLKQINETNDRLLNLKLHDLIFKTQIR